MKFPEGNKIVFSQDFRVWEGLPSDVDFEVHPIGQNSVKLVAPGYGGKPYGNGAIYVSRGMNEKQPNTGLHTDACLRCAGAGEVTFIPGQVVTCSICGGTGKRR